MMATVKKLAKAGAAANVECADSFGCVELVAGKSEKIDAERVDVDRNFSGGLNGVGVEENVVSVRRCLPICSSGWMVPSSLLACMTVMSAVCGRMASRTASGSTRPFAIDGKVGDFDCAG